MSVLDSSEGVLDSGLHIVEKHFYPGGVTGGRNIVQRFNDLEEMILIMVSYVESLIQNIILARG